MSLTIDVLNTKGEKVGNVDLPESIFGVASSSAVVFEVVQAYLANQRRGTHSTKTRAEVSGGGTKPWRQKHTGRARSGSIRSPLWRHGGIIFGPKPRSYYQAVSARKRHLALKMVLSDFFKGGKMKVVDVLAVSEAKTKRVAEIAQKLGFGERTMVVVDKIDPLFGRAARNIDSFRICFADNLNSHDALVSNQLVFTRSALDQIRNRLSRESAVAPASGASA